MKTRVEFIVSSPELADSNGDVFSGDRDETEEEEPRWEFSVLLLKSAGYFGDSEG